MGDNVEKSGIHLTGNDSGWPVGNAANEPPHTKTGDGKDPFPKAKSVSGGVVVDAGADEVQKITVAKATSGTFTLTILGKTTAAIVFKPKATDIQSAFEALSNLDPGDVTVTGVEGGPFTVAFGGKYVDTNVAQITADVKELKGEGAEVKVETTTSGKPL